MKTDTKIKMKVLVNVKRDVFITELILDKYKPLFVAVII